MNFDWLGYVRLAERLSNESDESSLRSAVSRAYYGVFCIARNKKGYQKYQKSDVHQKVIDEYLNSEDEDERSIGWLLIKLRKQRNYVDYNDYRHFDKAIAKKMIGLAKDILTLMKIPSK
jgi:uncharacterized protein (UPF0332 family)